MSRQCSTCGAIVRDDASVFCDRCGARLPAAGPAPVLTCRKCGKTQPDRQSRFCDRCGSPLAPAVLEMPPAAPALRRMACPVCGFTNTGEFLFYCRKCGSSLLRTGPVTGTGPVMESGPAMTGPARRPQDGVTGFPPGGTIAARPGPVSIPAPVYQGPAGVPAAFQEPSRGRRQEARKKRGKFSLKMLAPVAAGVVLLLVAVTVFTGIIPGMQDNRTANASVSNESSPGLFESIMKGNVPNPMAIFNKAAPVVTDTPLTVKTTPASSKATVKTPMVKKTSTTAKTNTTVRTTPPAGG